MKHVVVWFKRDLRIQDHLPLAQAAGAGRVSCVYFIEPDLWQSPDAATQHYRFILESLKDLQAQLGQVGLQLNVLVGCATDCLQRIMSALPFHALYSHEETGNGLTYERDKAVSRWCKQAGVDWHEYRQFGVRRGPHNRDNWKGAWQTLMALSTVPAPKLASPSELALGDPIPTLAQLGLGEHDPPRRQRGGRQRGVETLNEFLEHRSQQYRGGISSPLSAPSACSRLSVYLSYGCLSMREVLQATENRISELTPQQHRQKQGLQSFVSRLYWHCHFIQKLEDEPAIEFHNMHRGYDGLRESDWSEERFQALQAGRTGWPLVDACVAMLRETGWLNFRMRAMLVSVAAYPLWLHWRPVGHWLAQQFLDYEPGIHWSQMQMQSGTTGINVPRIYNPIKQAQDHDPRGIFVRRWLPKLRRVPDAWLFEPGRLPENLQLKYGVRVPQDIAKPICDLELATRQAKAKLFERRATPQVRAEKKEIVRKHGSRKQLEPAIAVTKKPSNSAQLSWDF